MNLAYHARKLCKSTQEYIQLNILCATLLQALLYVLEQLLSHQDDLKTADYQNEMKKEADSFKTLHPQKNLNFLLQYDSKKLHGQRK